MKNSDLTPPYARLLARLIRPFPDWDFFFIKPLRRQAVRELRLRKGDRVIDAGCGPGGSFPYLREAVGTEGEVAGIEISPETAKNARLRIQSNRWSNVRVIVADAREVQLAGKFNGLVMFAAPDVYASPEAISNLFQYLESGARVALFGAKISHHATAKPLNAIFRALMRLSFESTPQLTPEPWKVLQERLTDIRVQEHMHGCMFLAWGTAK